MLFTECSNNKFLRLVEVHEGDPQYLLPGREFMYECVSECRGSDEPVGQVCNGKGYTNILL